MSSGNDPDLDDRLHLLTRVSRSEDRRVSLVRSGSRWTSNCVRQDDVGPGPGTQDEMVQCSDDVVLVGGRTVKS